MFLLFRPPSVFLMPASSLIFDASCWISRPTRFPSPPFAHPIPALPIPALPDLPISSVSSLPLCFKGFVFWVFKGSVFGRRINADAKIISTLREQF
jgi:hypothetical protein